MKPTKKLSEIFKMTIQENPSYSFEADEALPQDCIPNAVENDLELDAHQWMSTNGTDFYPAGATTKILPAGLYEACVSPQGYFLKKVPIKTEGLIEFPQTNSEIVVKEIRRFWESENIFKECGLTYKRGILLYGPPGSGKSCVLQLLSKDVVNMGGIIINFNTDPYIVINCLRYLRHIQPQTPIIIIMEDIDEINRKYGESDVLNLLDGVNYVHKTVFLATTNYPERLGSRIVNRPSRFDKRFRIDHPNEETRRIYLNHIIGQERIEKMGINLEQWVQDSEGFSIAHLKGLFEAVYIFGDEYEEAIEMLSSMKEEIEPEKEFESNKSKIGFDGFYASKKTRPWPRK